jgi:hypothetical protein
VSPPREEPRAHGSRGPLEIGLLTDQPPVYSRLGELYVDEVQSKLLPAGAVMLLARRGEIPAEVAEGFLDDLLDQASEGLDHYLDELDRLDGGLAS